MITFIAHVRVRPENAEAYEALMTRVASETRAHEPGVAFYNWARCTDEPDVYVVVEVYHDAEAQAAHMTAPWVTDALPKAIRLMDGLPRIRQYVCGGSEPVRRTVASD